MIINDRYNRKNKEDNTSFPGKFVSVPGKIHPGINEFELKEPETSPEKSLARKALDEDIRNIGVPLDMGDNEKDDFWK